MKYCRKIKVTQNASSGLAFLLRDFQFNSFHATTQPEITCSKLTMETLEQGVKYVQS